MFKALLVIYVVGIGTGDDYTNSGSLTTTPFETMAQCEAAIKHAEDVIDDWHYGKDKSKVVPLNKTMKCFEIPPGPVPDIVAQPPAKQQEVVIESEPRTDRRWNDR